MILKIIRIMPGWRWRVLYPKYSSNIYHVINELYNDYVTVCEPLWYKKIE